MKPQRPGHRPVARGAAFALAAWAIVALASTPAVAQDLTKTVEDVVETLPTPTPDLDGTVGTVNDTVAPLKDKNLTEGEPEGSTTTPSGEPDGSGSDRPGDSGGHDRGKGASSIPVKKKPGAKPDASGSTSYDDREPYAALAARGAVAAAGRALRMAGPLAPALGLAIVAMFVVFGLSRGSRSLVKLDEGKFPERTYRL